ncbi:Carboxylesterase [Stachybotrys elegans]|uniref:Carboxylic ester hydrolase n=1 Tax=Stachybotrys elegans TaxID=80388 RepID=A0A8K0WUU6_9HYPO|nr:Carboxylesterase [Stachybotrys elegans]
MSDSHDTKHAPCAAITVESGRLSGLRLSNGTRAFLGVPYAAPPVGELRWRPPQSPHPWDGVRAADRFGPSSIQFPPPATSLYSGGETEFSEDCLYLNVYTGSESATDDKRPVMVWFHIGAFMWGSAAHPWFDGTGLAAAGVTVVTANYRLGRLGFLAHPELTAESRSRASGNYGIMDQIAALKWVQRNIEAFGGDAKNVTIGGASAGGASVHLLRCAPTARPLFSKAICDGGPGLAPPADGHGHVATYMTLGAAEKAGAELLDALGVSSISQLREVPAEDIMRCQMSRAQGPWKSAMGPSSISLSAFDTANPIIDGNIVPESPLAMFLSGSVADVPLLAGNAGNESSGMPYLDSLAAYQAFADEAFGHHAKDLLRLYPSKTDSEARAATASLLADQCFVWPTWTSARLQAGRMRSPAWYYRSARAPPIPPDADLIERDHAGAFHVSPAIYAFGSLGAAKWDWDDGDRALSARVVQAWVRFMQTGDPNGMPGEQQHAVDYWPALNPGGGGDSIMIWDVESRSGAPGSRFLDMVAFWDGYYGLRGSMSGRWRYPDVP